MKHHPDAKLLTLCARFDEIERQSQSYYRGGVNHIVDDDERDAVLEPIREPLDNLAEKMTAIRAQTPEGQIARARSLLLWAPDLVRRGDGDIGQILMHGVLRDLVKGTEPDTPAVALDDALTDLNAIAGILDALGTGHIAGDVVIEGTWAQWLSEKLKAAADRVDVVSTKAMLA